RSLLQLDEDALSAEVDSGVPIGAVLACDATHPCVKGLNVAELPYVRSGIDPRESPEGPDLTEALHQDDARDPLGHSIRHRDRSRLKFRLWIDRPGLRLEGTPFLLAKTWPLFSATRAAAVKGVPNLVGAEPLELRS